LRKFDARSRRDLEAGRARRDRNERRAVGGRGDDEKIGRGSRGVNKMRLAAQDMDAPDGLE